MTCASCQAQLPDNSTFCSHCGAPVSSAGAATGPAAAAIAPVRPAASGLSDNAAAAIAYITFIPAILFLVMEPYNHIKFVRFHAWQCLGLTVASVVAHLIAVMIPGVGWMLSPFISLAFLAVWIITILKASKGEWFKLPLIGDFAEKQANS